MSASGNQDPPASGFDDRHFVSTGRILLLAGPLVLSQMGVMLMQIVDGIFLSRYSENAIAAVGPAGMTFWLVCGMFIGLAGYTNTFVAQYMGAGRFLRVGASVWQGIYLAVAAGVILAFCALFSEPLFRLVGHEAETQKLEVIYFRILSVGGVTFVLSSALSGFYAGRHDNLVLMIAHLVGGLTNALLDYLLIFGRWGFEEMGMAGAAWGTVIGHLVQCLILGALLFRSRFRHQFGTWTQRRIELELIGRLMRYGFPNGVRYVLEIAAWTVFLMILGRIDPSGLAASNIAWRINGMAFFPVIGLSIAISMLVGQAQGASRPDLSRRVTHRGLLIGQVWMTSAAAVMVLFPQVLLSAFFEEVKTEQQRAIYDMTVKLLWFVAAYCIMDNFNIIFMSMLAGAGDTRWLLITSGVLHGFFLLVLLAMAYGGAGTYMLWLAATTFVCSVAIAWMIRFKGGSWENKRVIEPVLPDLPNPEV
jgi:MATE family multidrug resistance protein